MIDPAFDSLSAFERLFVLSNGYLQQVFAAVCRQRVELQVVHNGVQRDDGVDGKRDGRFKRVFERQINLVLDGRIIYTATSRVEVYEAEVFEQLQSNQIGLGQLFQKYSLRPVFQLLSCSIPVANDRASELVKQRCDANESAYQVRFQLDRKELEPMEGLFGHEPVTLYRRYCLDTAKVKSYISEIHFTPIHQQERTGVKDNALDSQLMIIELAANEGSPRKRNGSALHVSKNRFDVLHEVSSKAVFKTALRERIQAARKFNAKSMRSSSDGQPKEHRAMRTGDCGNRDVKGVHESSTTNTGLLTDPILHGVIEKPLEAIESILFSLKKQHQVEELLASWFNELGDCTSEIQSGSSTARIVHFKSSSVVCVFVKVNQRPTQVSSVAEGFELHEHQKTVDISVRCTSVWNRLDASAQSHLPPLVLSQPSPYLYRKYSYRDRNQVCFFEDHVFGLCR